MLRTREFAKVLSRSISSSYTHSPATINEKRLRVATVDQHTNGGRVALVVNTGARDDECKGLTHAMQAAAVLNGEYNTAFLATQLLANFGASLEVNVDRENIKYEVSCHPAVMGDVVSTLLIPTVLGNTYPHWQLEDVYEKMTNQRAVLEMNPVFRLLEGVHKAAFNGGMANPIVSPAHMIGKHDSEMILNRFDSTFQLKNMVLVGSGISQKELEEYGEEGIQISNKFGFDSDSELARPKPVFAGREVHIDEESDVSHVALAYEGLALGDSGNYALGVLQNILGTKGNVKRGSELARGTLNKLVDEYVQDYVFSTSAANINYSDCGLFCIHIVSDPDGVDTVARATAAELARIASSPIEDELMEAGKNRLLSSIAMSYEDTEKLVRDTATQAATLNTKLDKGNLVFEIEKVTAEDVSAVAAKVLQGKFALTTFGNTSTMPTIRDLNF